MSKLTHGRVDQMITSAERARDEAVHKNAKLREALESIRETLEAEQWGDEGMKGWCETCEMLQTEGHIEDCIFPKLFEILDGAMPKGGA